MMKFTSVVLSASLLGLSNAECPNACSSHGICTNYDMCQCYRNWMANDCSERVCQFGLAHVDTPKGDLDASSGALAGPGVTVIPNSQVYPYGTTEQFPRMVDSNNGPLSNTAHYYMECSNKGICDRQAGVCECFPGYEGSACQRASCPSNSDGVCSGHGTCQSIKELSNNDYNNIYELWDKSATLGCDCDPGYYGADCSLRQCKYGVDPLYVDDGLATPRYANWTFGFYTAPVSNLDITGNYSIVFYDVFGEDWRTDAIQYTDGCDVITDKLENLPNNAVPKESVLCYQYPTPSATLSGKVPPGSYTFRKLVTLVFTGNPGALQQIALDLYLDGPRPTLVSDEATSTLGSFVFANGYHGEFIDYVSDYCEGVEVTLDTTNRYLSGISTPEAILLKRCLGDSDGDESNNAAEIYNWDHGDQDNPHLIKLVETTAHPFTHICNTTNLYYPPLNQLDWCENFKPAGFYLPVYFDGTHFRFVGNLNTVYGTSTTFRVFTTKGRLEKVAEDADIQYHFTQNGPYSNKIAYPDLTGAAGAIDCETRTAAAGSCLNKGDRVMFFNFDTVANNPELHNIYTVKRVGRDRDPDDYTPTTMIDLDMGINFGSAATIFAYKFWPATGSSWAAECSDRGVCDSSSGICKCFRGYTSDDCSVQSTLAK